MPRRPRPPRLAMLTLLGAVLAAVTLPGVALAHADLASASPGSGATIAPGPATLVVSFTEALDPAKSSIEVRDASGSIVASGGAAQVSADRLSMTVPLPALTVGTYEVRWTSTAAAEGHIERGTYRFTVAAGASIPAASAASVGAVPTASPGPSAGGSVAPTPGAAPGGGSSSTSDLETILPIILALVAVVLIAVVLVRRRRPQA